jgi:hypothetical protein
MARITVSRRSVWFAGVGAIVVAAGALAGPLDALRELVASPEPVAGIDIQEVDADAAMAAAEKEKNRPPAVMQPGVVNCANLVYGDSKSSVCFSSEFLAQASQDSHIRTNEQLVPVHLESAELFQFPFAVMTGEGSFSLTEAQRANMRDYLQAGGFIIASAGCSSEPWRDSFLREIRLVLPELSLERIDPTHPVFHTVYDISELKCKGSHRAHLEGMEIDGKIVLIFSSDGLNDTAKAGGSCCCCGGNEIKNSRQMNVNLLAYTLTH